MMSTYQNTESLDVVSFDGMEHVVKDLSIEKNAIRFTPDKLTIFNVLNTFKNVTSITISKEGSSEPYGVYENITFKSASVFADDSVQVTFSIMSDTDDRLRKLESEIEGLREMTNN